MKKFFLIFLLQLLFVFPACAASNQLFYQQPTLPKLIETTKELSETLPPDNQLAIDSFILMALNNHKDLVQQVIAELPSYDKKLRVYLIQGLVNLRGKKILKELPNDLANEAQNVKSNLSVRDVNGFNLRTRIKSKEAMQQNTHYGECIWSAFYATGEEKYLQKFLQYLVNTPKDVRTFAFELINRDAAARIESGIQGEKVKSSHDDIDEALAKEKSINEWEVKSCYDILYALTQIRTQQPDVDGKIGSLIAKNPRLDYGTEADR
jgi:hypothetical protein